MPVVFSSMNPLFLRRAQLAVTCCAIAANALCAGGIFTFPLISPALASHLKLTQPQLTTIVLAGMVGQYPLASIVGNCIDKYGPWACSLVSSVLFFFGFGLFSWEIANTPVDITHPSLTSFRRLTVFFFMAGLGTVFSYFSSLFAASKNFPNHLGMASGTSMALFGLSPLFLSVIASKFFTDPEIGLNVTEYLRFLSVLTGLVHLFGAFNIKTPAAGISISDTEQASNVDERSPLLPSTSHSNVDKPSAGSAMDLLRDPSFWVLAFFALVTLGSCEMVISNIGTIVLSLPPSTSMPSAELATSTQVRLISIANTLSRLLVGPLADFVSPVASYLPNGVLAFPRKHFISRVFFLCGAALLLAVTFLRMGVNVRSQGALWSLSVGTGIAYGTIFTILPSIVSSVWGLSNLGRNFGILTYAPFIGTPLFSYFYAFVSAHQSGDQGVCQGTSCWQLTFGVSAGAVLLVFGTCFILWRTWEGKV